MGEIKDAYEIITDLADRLAGGKKLKRKKMGDYLRKIASLLDEARARFEAKKVPYREGRQLAVTINRANELAARFKKKHPGLSVVFDQWLPHIGKLMRDADFFIDEHPRYAVHEAYQKKDADFSGLATSKIDKACREMARAAGAIEAYAMEF